MLKAEPFRTGTIVAILLGSFAWFVISLAAEIGWPMSILLVILVAVGIHR